MPAEPASPAASSQRLTSAFRGGLLLVLAVYAAKLAFDLRDRIRYPWDILTCFETPFVNAMLKLRAGESIYSAPALANSEVYPPGVHYLTYAVLRPFGVDIDIRWDRLVAVMLSFITAAVATWCAAKLCRSLAGDRRLDHWSIAVMAIAFWLQLHKNMTSDQPHPDNLHVMHAVVLFALLLVMLERGSFRWAVAAVTWASLSLLAKQTAVLAPVAALATVVAARRWSVRQWVTLSVIACLLEAFVVVVISRDFGFFHVFQEMAGHSFVNVPWLVIEPLLDGGKLSPLYFVPRPLLVLLTPAVALFVFNALPSRSWLVAWAAIGGFELMPSLVAFFKVGGNFNNLGGIDFWLLLLVMPVLLVSFRVLADSGDGWLRSPQGALTATGLVALFVSLYPIKLRPHADAFAFGERLQREVQQSVAAGERVWLPTGLMFLVRAGRTAPADDLAICLWTAEQGRSAALQIHERLQEWYYDRVYFLFPWELGVRTEVDQRYRVIEHVRGIDEYGWHKDHRGIQPYLTAGYDVLVPLHDTATGS